MPTQSIRKKRTDKSLSVQIDKRSLTKFGKVEEKRKLAEEEYRTIVRTAMDGFWIVDMDGRFLDVNDAYCYLTGYSRDELLTMRISDMEAVERPEETASRIQKIREFGGDRFESQHKCKDGKIIDVEVSVNYIGVGGGQMFVFLRDITEQKRAEKELRENDERLQALMDASPIGISWSDLEGNIKYNNRKFRELFGYTIEDIPTISEWRRMAYPDPAYRETVPLLLPMLTKAQIEQKEVTSMEVMITCKDGSSRYVEQMGALAANRILITFRDITERKQAEEALLKSQKMLEKTFASLREAVFIIDFNSVKIIDCNPAASEMFGYSLEEMTGRTTTFLHVDEATLDEFRKHLYAAIKEKGFLFLSEFRMKRKDGTIFCTEHSVMPIEDQQGNQVGWVSVVRDITEYKQAEEALRKSEERFRQLFDYAPVGYQEFDTEGRITRVNRTELEMLGYTEEEMLGRHVWNLIAEERPIEPLIEALKERLSGTLPPRHSFERNIRRKNGTIFPALIQERLLREDEGRIMGIRSTIQDITELKQAEERTNTLQEQLRQSQKMEAIGRLAGGIAHDFNNLLTVIKGYSQLSLLEIKEGDPLKGNIEEIQKASQRAADLTRQLLAFSRRQILELRVFDLNTVLKDLDKMLRRIIGEDIELVYLLSDDLGKINTDPVQIEQVILNLAVNARDAMPSGGRLTIETANVVLDEACAHGHTDVKPGPYIMLSVSDSGCGMSQEVMEHLFEPFFTTKEKGMGTGLGLSTVYGIIKQSGGDIRVHSEEGRGTVFKIYLPKVEETLKEWGKKESKEDFPSGNETILVVEDDFSVRGLAVRVLQRQGYTVLEASNGDEALRVGQEKAREKIHLLLTDVIMPGMSGSELAERLVLFHSSAKVLYISGYTDNSIVHHGILKPGIAFLQKPFSPEALARKVREVLDGGY
jgi:PAS domain S-box-containing protein